jgi:gentisate 1,2-dioxygenase
MTKEMMQTDTNQDFTTPALYLTLDKTFGIYRPPVPAKMFLDEPAEALEPDAETAIIYCDQSDAMDAASPSTTPLLLSGYLRVNPRTPLTTTSGGSTEFHYVIQGSGSTEWDGGTIKWCRGDAMILPGGIEYTHRAVGDSNAVLWMCSNAPLLAFENARPAEPDSGPVGPTYFPADKIVDALERVRTLTIQSDGSKSTALLLSTESMAGKGVSSPSMTLVFNTVDPHQFQSPHLHNSVAVTLVLKGEKSYSIVDGKRIDWSPFATFVTPAGSVHSHHNDHDQDSLFLIVQDGGLYYHCRTIGFEAR